MILHKVHGGAWKVAYADFVTAMMALFMVLWISSQDQEILIQTAQYFQNPFNSPLRETYGVMPKGAPSFKGDNGQATSIVDMDFLHSLAKEFFKLLNLDDSKSNRPVDVKITSDGLRITIFDQGKHGIFDKYSDNPTRWGEQILQNMAWVLDRYDFKVRIDAFTSQVSADEKNVPQGYDPWDLTTRRANRARQLMQYYALSADKIDRITGFGDAHPLANHTPTDPTNQRLELSVVVD